MNDVMKRIVRFGVIGIGLVMLLVFIGKIGVEYSDHRTGMQDSDLRIADLRKELLVQNALLEEAEAELAEIEGGKHDIGSAGTDIASWQNRYAQKSDSYGTTQLAGQAEVTAEINDIRIELSEYFDDVYLWFDWDFQKSDCEWVCVTNHAFYGDTFDVLWVCRGRGGRINTVYAYATATYSVSTGRFSNLRTGVTQVGQSVLVVRSDGTEG